MTKMIISLVLSLVYCNWSHCADRLFSVMNRLCMVRGKFVNIFFRNPGMWPVFFCIECILISIPKTTNMFCDHDFQYWANSGSTSNESLWHAVFVATRVRFSRHELIDPGLSAGYCSHEASVVATLVNLRSFERLSNFFLRSCTKFPHLQRGALVIFDASPHGTGFHFSILASSCPVLDEEWITPHRASSPHQSATAPETLTCLTETMMRSRSSAVVASPLKCIDVFPPPLLFRGPLDKGLVPRKTGLAQGPFGWASSPHQSETAPETLSCQTETMMRSRSSAVVASPLKCIDVFPPPLLFRGPRDKGLVPRKTGLAQGPFGWASSPHQSATAPETLTCLTETMTRSRSSAVVASPLKCIDVFPPPLLFRGPRDKGLVPRKTGLAQGPFGWASSPHQSATSPETTDLPDGSDDA